DSDIVVINTNVILTNDVTLKYPGGKLLITKNGSLCGNYTLNCNCWFYGPVSCKSIIFLGSCYSTSGIVLTNQIYATNPAYVFESIGCFNIGTGVPAACSQYTVPQADFIATNACVGQPIIFTDKSTGSFLCVQWLFPGGSPSWSYLEDPTVVYSSPGFYTVTLIASNDKGTDTLTRTIYINPLPTVCCNATISIDQSVQLNTTNSISCSWQPSSGLSCTNCCNPVASPLATTTYTVTMVSDSGCSATELITIDVNCNIFVPEAFSPNNDGQNDVLYVRGDCIKTLDFIVFDRWGNKVFETNDKDIGWDGYSKGEAMNTGEYVYSLTATKYDGTTIEKKGNVALVR
ncbi:MAG TPA: gliding motility-associated C-terminal domain-containing protein, partial [Bacteroidia bacterium]|nr:gliding motility-associated C-terminal domain-containing protein [Bacteroidia bacterium]